MTDIKWNVARGILMFKCLKGWNPNGGSGCNDLCKFLEECREINIYSCESKRELPTTGPSDWLLVSGNRIHNGRGGYRILKKATCV
jgi:hypothetical protein